MDIEFCDICGESVPIGDLDQGGAKRHGQRLVCRRCDDAMTRHVAPAAAHSKPTHASGAHVSAAHVPQSSGSSVLWLMAACVGVVALVGVLAVDRVADAERRVQGDVAGQVLRLDGRIADLERAFEHGLVQVRADRAGDDRFDRILARLEAIEDEVESGDADVPRLLEELLLVTDDLRARPVDDVEARNREDERFLALSSELTALRQDLGLLARSMLEVLETAPVAVEPPAEVKREAAEAQPGWLVFVGSLSSNDDGERWNAVEELGASNDPEAAEYVVPLLEDSELFVRMAAARVLGDLGNEVAIGPLIDALEDVEPSVREASVMSLRLLTGKSFRFEPNGDPRERAKGIEDWRKWWKGTGARSTGSDEVVPERAQR
ncbi:HEAT repeat protein [Planctomycetes bacterium Pla163]|uniref:HEAT repeat protein n=1 Tax=Rohdeia mirabilis TaxID=2528008 RepID=A0A518D174_9BACT|nr:HEAT repeat protein [Planctomycetes bacterium Pla163]